MTTAIKELQTVGQLARQLNIEIDKVRYRLKSRRIQPVARVAGRYVYDQTTLTFLQAEFKGKQNV